MLLDQTICFENPKMPDWLFYNFQIAFKTKNKEFINGYQKLWEGMMNG
jgi:hypothetical protein